MWWTAPAPKNPVRLQHPTTNLCIPRIMYPLINVSLALLSFPSCPAIRNGPLFYFFVCFVFKFTCLSTVFFVLSLSHSGLCRSDVRNVPAWTVDDLCISILKIYSFATIF